MSIKHVKEYYAQIYSQYAEMREDIKDLEEAVSNNIVMPEVLEQTIAQLDKLKENYQRINYIMFLLDMPNKKEKIPRYKQRLKAKLKDIPNSVTLEAIKTENAECLKAFNKDVMSLNCIK